MDWTINLNFVKQESPVDQLLLTGYLGTTEDMIKIAVKQIHNKKK